MAPASQLLRPKHYDYLIAGARKFMIGHAPFLILAAIGCVHAMRLRARPQLDLVVGMMLWGAVGAVAVVFLQGWNEYQVAAVHDSAGDSRCRRCRGDKCFGEELWQKGATADRGSRSGDWHPHFRGRRTRSPAADTPTPVGHYRCLRRGRSRVACHAPARAPADVARTCNRARCFDRFGGYRPGQQDPHAHKARLCPDRCAGARAFNGRGIIPTSRLTTISRSSGAAIPCQDRCMYSAIKSYSFGRTAGWRSRSLDAGRGSWMTEPGGR